MRRTGKYAYVNGIPCTKSWQFTETTTVSRYRASCVPDGSGTTPGNKNFTGSMSGMGYLPPFPDSEDMAFVGVASGQAGQLVNYVGTILVNEATINIPVNAGTPIDWTAAWGAQGEITKETATLYEDATRTPAAAAKDGKVSIEGTPDSGTFTDVDAVQNITLTFRRPVTEYVDDGLFYREAGVMEADISFRVENDDAFVALYATNNTRRVRVYVTPTDYFLFDAITWREHANFVVDRESNALIGYDVSGWWTALRQRTPPALGQILLPGGEQLYPVT